MFGTADRQFSTAMAAFFAISTCLVDVPFSPTAVACPPREILLAGRTYFGPEPLRAEFFSLHGTPIAAVVPALSADKRSEAFLNLPFLRYPERTESHNVNYLSNLRRSQDHFRQFWESWLGGETKNYLMWRTGLKQQHLWATGKKTNTPHQGPGDRYDSCNTNEVDPGYFRHECNDKQSLRAQIDPEVMEHVKNWLPFAEMSGAPTSSQVLQIQFRGISEKLKKHGRGLEERTFPTAGFHYVVYPGLRDVPFFLELAWERLTEVKASLTAYQQAKQNLFPELTPIREEALDTLSDYFHTVSSGHFFKQVNNSIAMSEINTFLPYLDLLPVRHGRLDMVALRMDYFPFRQYFRQFIFTFQESKNSP